MNVFEVIVNLSHQRYTDATGRAKMPNKKARFVPIECDNDRELWHFFVTLRLWRTPLHENTKFLGETDRTTRISVVFVV